MIAYTRLGFDRANAIVTFPIVWVGSPLPLSFFQVSPPSLDVNRPLPGPPLSRPQVFISSCHMPAKAMRGLLGSSTTSEQPVFLSTKRTLSHVLPPSAVRKTPRSGCGPYAWPRAQARTTSGFRGSIAILPIRPVRSSPMCVQVLPASVDL